ncbi:MAG: carboxypeptidase-like regulatory domain-containing protein, partial [Bacteroidales bacterium]|nr:carboxypeptidase-like regulatory domain-containing protein [Bacteroidales bacterium]
MKRIFLLIGLLATCFAQAQQIHVFGFVNDAHDGECVIGANVYLQDLSRGVATDQKGYFNLTVELPATFCVSCIGYEEKCIKVDQADKPLQIHLQPLTETLHSVEVKATRIERKTFNTLTLNAKSIDQIPTIGSRPDIIKAAQQLPGIEAATEASSLMIVRGGNPGENLYLLDNVPLIYVNHLGGFMSVFNSEMINTMDIYKGGFPARYGGKLSSIVDLTAKKGDPTRLKGSVSAGLTDLAFAVEGSGGLKNSSFIVTGRKTFTEALLFMASEISKVADAQDYNIIYGFHDINAKYTWAPDAKNSFALNVYEGDDYMRIWKNKKENGEIERNSIGNIWGNLLVSGQWNSAVSSRLFMANTLSFTQYRLKNNMKVDLQNSMDTTNFFIKAASRVSDVSLRSDWKLFVGNSYTLEYGLQSSYLNYRPNHFTSSFSEANLPDVSSVFDNSLYLDNIMKFGAWFNGSIGLRVNSFLNNGYHHFAWEPRLNLSFNIGQSILNLTAMRVTQNAHLMMTPGSIMNNEVWIPADARIKPATSDQASIGWQRSFWQDHVSVEIDAYYKLLRDLATYREGYGTLLGDSDWRSKVEAGGKGKSYGIEMMTRFNFNRLDGYVGYTLSHTTRQFDHINNGKEYVYEYDRPHSVNINVNYQLTERWSLSALWTYQTGLPYTPVIGVQNTPGITPGGDVYIEQTNIYGVRNSARMRDYHRLDLAAKFKTKTEKGRKAEWTFSIYNVYCRQNPYYYYYGDPKGDPLYWNQFPDDPQQLWQRSFFPIIPSFS